MVILVTGSRKGIGRYISEEFLKNGDTVIGCSRSESDLKHENYVHYTLDVCDEKAVRKLSRDVSKRFGTVDVLINNAGIASMNHIMLTTVENVKRILDTNFIGTFLFTREISKMMIKSNYGRIINFSSVAVPTHLQGEAIYASSKSAICEFTKISAKELGEYGITVNAVGPTPVQTDLIKNVSDDKIDNLIQHQAVKRLGTVEDVMNVINFFIDKKSDFITGQVIYLGGL